MPDPRLVPMIRTRIERGDHQAVFAHGECFRFALRFNERFGYKIRGVKTYLDRPQWSHVWALRENKGIDIYGVHEERLLAALNGNEAADIIDADVEEIRTMVLQKEYPPDLDRQLNELADHIIDTHERFLMVKPPKEKMPIRLL
jgi:hypothetical protein